MSISKYAKPSNPQTRDLPSPRDIIPQSNIEYRKWENSIVINKVKGIWLTTVQDTNSMDPTVDAGHTCILTSNFNLIEGGRRTVEDGDAPHI